MKKLNLIQMSNYYGKGLDVSDENCAVAGVIGTVLVIANPVAGLTFFGGMALAGCDLI
ncbi:hypothetical protein [Marivirga sp.]|uniref:hypothetical protein n=1 Tax=Marivirga sp. TaxID=2018662 RepID=UPI003DA770EB